jgi:putative PIG3 family NAD(P)H quinone oxidoreductase
MRAVTIHDGALVIEDRPVPEPAPDEALVRVHGAGLNRPDLVQRLGFYPAPPGAPPDVPGLEFAGVVERVGAEVSDARTGDRVFGVAGGGAQAEYLTVPAVHCARVPDGLDLLAMGGVPETFITAHDAMVSRAAVRPGEWLLVHAVGSGVGTAAVQLAKAFGASVAGTARTRDKLDRCRSLGLDVGIVPPSREDGSLDPAALATAILETAGEMDVVLDLAGGRYVETDIAVCALKGRIVLIGAMAGGRAELDVLGAMGKRLTIAGTLLRPRDKQEKAAATAAFERDVVPLLASGTVAPIVEKVMPIEAVEDAYELLESNTTFGKIILDCR